MGSFHPILFNLMLILIRLIILIFFFTYVSIFRWSNNSNYLYKYFNYKWKNFFKKIFSFNFFLFFGFLFFVFKKNIFSKINSSNFFPIMVYENINIFLITFLILYLLFTLICVVKLVKFEYGPLVKRL